MSSGTATTGSANPNPSSTGFTATGRDALPMSTGSSTSSEMTRYESPLAATTTQTEAARPRLSPARSLDVNAYSVYRPVCRNNTQYYGTPQRGQRMSIRRGLLALLAQEPMYGAQLRSEFESRTGGTWPLNVGQVYTTLARLERDGLVEAAWGADAEGRINYRLTDLGRTEVQRWWSAPVDRGDTPRDELVIKLALAVTVPGVDIQRLVQTQRTATLRHLQDLTKLKRSTPDAVSYTHLRAH